MRPSRVGTFEPPRPVVVLAPAEGGRFVRLASAGVALSTVPGLLIVPWYVPRGAVKGRFALLHEASGLLVVARPLCPHDARRWAEAAGWIGVDWTAHAFTITASGPARLFAWRMCDEWRRSCEVCGGAP